MTGLPHPGARKGVLKKQEKSTTTRRCSDRETYQDCLAQLPNGAVSQQHPGLPEPPAAAAWLPWRLLQQEWRAADLQRHGVQQPCTKGRVRTRGSIADGNV